MSTYLINQIQRLEVTLSLLYMKLELASASKRKIWIEIKGVKKQLKLLREKNTENKDGKPIR